MHKKKISGLSGTEKAGSKQRIAEGDDMRKRIGAFLGAAFLSFSAGADVTFDGTVGDPAFHAPPPLIGNNRDIPQQAGQTIDANLFHSFGRFSIDAGEMVTFCADAGCGPSDINNIITRVTGIGEPSLEQSVINGTLFVDGAGTGFWMVNPAGILVGEGAFFDVAGDLALGAADNVTFADGFLFNAFPSGGEDPSTFSSALPEDFGVAMPTSTAGDIAIDNVSISREGNIVLVAVGDISLRDATIRTESTTSAVGGDIRLEANRIEVLSSNITAQAGSDSGGQPSLVGGDIDLVADAKIVLAKKNPSASGSSVNARSIGSGAAGMLSAEAEEIVVRDSSLTSNAFGPGDGGLVQLRANSVRLADRGLINTATSGTANAGSVVIEGLYGGAAESVKVIGDGNFASSYIFTGTTDTATGDGGDITIRTAGLDVKDTGLITAQVSGSGDGGTVEINADHLRMERGGIIEANSFGIGDSGGVVIQGVDSTEGNATWAQSVKVLSNSTIGSSSFSLATDGGSAGTLSVSAEEIKFNDGSAVAQIRGDGTGGNISLSGGSVLISNDASVNVKTEGDGDAGDISINGANTVLIDRAQLLAETTGDGDAGDISIDGPEIVLLNGATVSAKTFQAGSGSAGNVLINGTNTVKINVDSAGDVLDGNAFVNVSSNSDTAASGSTGNVVINGGDLDLARANIRAKTISDVGLDRGSVRLNAGDGNVRLRNVRLRASTAGLADAGDIDVRGHDIELYDDTLIRTLSDGSVGVAGSAGTVRIVATNSVTSNIDDNGTPSIDDEQRNRIIASSKGADGGATGNIRIKAPTIDIANTGIFSSIAATREDLGRSSVLLEAINGSVSLRGGTKISVEAYGNADANTATIHADSVIVDNAEINAAASDQFDIAATGDAGDIQIEAESVVLRNGAVVSAETKTAGNAGNVLIRATDAVRINVDSDGDVIESADMVLVSSDSTIPEFGSAADIGAAGGVKITGGQLNLARGEIRAKTDSNLDGEAASIRLDAVDGLVQLRDMAVVATTRGDANGGNINISGGSIIIEGTRQALSLNDVIGTGIEASTRSGDGDAGNVTISGADVLLLDGAQISAKTSRLGGGDAGNVTINGADSVRVNVDDAGDVIAGSQFVLITSESVTETSGSAGNVVINGGDLDLARVNIRATTKSNLGDKSALNPDGNDRGSVRLDAGSNDVTLRTARVRATTEGTTSAGDIEIRGRDITIYEKTQIQSLSDGDESVAGTAGSVRLVATNSITSNIDESGAPIVDENHRNRIATSSRGADGGATGNIRIKAPTIDLANTGVASSIAASRDDFGQSTVLLEAVDGALSLRGTTQISTETFGNADANTATILADSVIVDNAEILAAAADDFDSAATGDAGNILIDSASVILRNSAMVSAETETAGSAGDVTIRANNVQILGDSSVEASTSGTGAGGNVQIESVEPILATAFVVDPQVLGALTIDGSQVLSSSTGAGIAGNVTLNADAGVNLINGALVATSASTADGGSIVVNTSGDLVLLESFIVTSVGAGDGDGGNIDLNIGTGFLQKSGILAQADDGDGGAINIAIADDGLFISDTESFINADSNTGTAGQIKITSPELDINSVVSAPAVDIEKDPELQQSLCATDEEGQSTFYILDQGGVASPPDGYLPPTIGNADIELDSETSSNAEVVGARLASLAPCRKVAANVSP